MSEPTLYRIEYRKPNEPDTFVSILQDGGLLVPVEPDYEAATAKLIEQGPSDFTDENVARNIIHAAFRGAEIGGDDE